MAKMDQTKQPGSGGGTYEETPAQKEGWKKLRAYVREQGLAKGDTFTVKGTVAKIKLDGTDDNPRYFTSKQTNDKGEEKDWPFVKAYCAITDPAFGPPGTLDFPPKNVGASFFDGKTSKGQSPNRGGMFNLHKAVTGNDPSEALIKGNGSWDTEDYENQPILLRLLFDGKAEVDSPYANRRAGMVLWVNGFEKDREVHKAPAADWDDEDDEEDAPFPTSMEKSAGSSATAAAAKSTVPASSSGNTISNSTDAATIAKANADLSVLPATERQVAFVYALGRECDMDKHMLAGWCEATYECEPEMLTRKEASAAIDALQRKRNELDGITGMQALKEVTPTEGTDELVGVGVSKKPTPPKDDSDLNF
jgi:hypothetical protein